MSLFLQKVHKGVKQTAQTYVFHGAPGIGKTTFAAQFPSPIIADLEDGSKHLDVARLTSQDIPNYKELVSFTQELAKASHDYKTLVIDSATVLESYVHKHLCGDKYETIEDVGGGFGKGYQMAREELQKFMQLCRALTSNSINVIICAHSQVKSFTDPLTNSSYDRYIIQTNAKFAEILTSAADNVFFMKHAVDTVVDQKTKKTQAFGSGKRLLMTEWRPAYEAKNRLNLPSELPLDYAAFLSAIEMSKPKSADELIKEIKAMLAKADDQNRAIATQKLQEAGDNVNALLRIKTKLSTMVTV